MASMTYDVALYLIAMTTAISGLARRRNARPQRLQSVARKAWRASMPVPLLSASGDPIKAQ